VGEVLVSLGSSSKSATTKVKSAKSGSCLSTFSALILLPAAKVDKCLLSFNNNTTSVKTNVSADDRQLLSFWPLNFWHFPLLHRYQYQYHHAACVPVHNRQKIQRPKKKATANVFVFGQPFVKRFALCYRTAVLSVCLSCPVCNVGVLWPNGWMDQDAT